MKKILIIDDEELILFFLKQVLTEEGYHVVTAADGEKGLELFRAQSADLVITDLVMPVKDGLKTIIEIREIDEAIPIVAISGGGTIAKERYLTVAGCLDNVKAMA
ncbi:MAG: response regulator, partial [Desulfopila sp.]|nr:response regulator [Desulfopila sp.]